MSKDLAAVDKPIKMTPRQVRFIDLYCILGNATQSAIQAGYSAQTAAVIGHENLRKPYIAEAVKKRLNEGAMSAEEALKRTADIARADLKPYMIVERQVVNRQEELPLDVYIAEQEEEIAIEEEWASEADLPEAEFDVHYMAMQNRKREVLKLQIELRRNPSATRFVSRKKTIEREKLDIVAIIKDKSFGPQIKSYQMTENGPKIELYNADGALYKLLQAHGLLKDGAINILDQSSHQTQVVYNLS